VSGTFNAIHPDPTYRAECLRRVGVLASRCAALGTKVITLCTGTRDAGYMWRFHPDNATTESWAEMVETMRRLVDHAEENSVTLAFEPEVVNVVDTAEKAERLIDEIGSNRLGVVMDPANYFHPHTLERMPEVLADAFAHVGEFIVLAHAKDVRGPEPGGRECIRPAAGTGVLDYATYLRLLRDSDYDGALIMHSLEEQEVPASRDYVRQHMAAAGLR
jgi:sugar phosphate isomerase/epimerase